MLNIELARHNMIEQQVRPWDVLDPRVLEAMATVRREDFVADAHRNLAFADLELPLGHGESMLKPVLEGRLLQALALEPGEEVLEIGTGSGFVTACLAQLARAVTSIDIQPDFIASARTRLDHAGIGNARLEIADALAWQPGRQFDAIAVTAAVAQVPAAFADWLRPGGRMFIVHGRSPVQDAVRATRRGDSLHLESLFETDISYLRGAAPAPQFNF